MTVAYVIVFILGLIWGAGLWEIIRPERVDIEKADLSMAYSITLNFIKNEERRLKRQREKIDKIMGTIEDRSNSSLVELIAVLGNSIQMKR